MFIAGGIGVTPMLSMLRTLRAPVPDLCGPPMMVTAVGLDLSDRGVPTLRIHIERFEVV